MAYSTFMNTFIYHLLLQYLMQYLSKCLVKDQNLVNDMTGTTLLNWPVNWTDLNPTDMVKRIVKLADIFAIN